MLGVMMVNGMKWDIKNKGAKMTINGFKFTQHALKRVNNRGIVKEMIMLTLEFGKVYNDKIVLLNKTIKKLLLKIKDPEIKKWLIKLIDKKGLTLVVDNGTIITVYSNNK